MAVPLQIDPFITPGHMTGVQKESIHYKPAEMTEKPEEMKVNEVKLTTKYHRHMLDVNVFKLKYQKYKRNVKSPFAYNRLIYNEYMLRNLSNLLHV